MKRDWHDLALCGGDPAFASPLHVGRPNQGNRSRLLGLVEGMLDRNWLTNDGPLVQAFERGIEQAVGVDHCVATSSGTVALELAIRALGLSGEVIVPAFTFVATAHALQWQGITPRFCDVDPITHNIDPDQVEALIGPRTTGILAVHLWGRPCDVDALADIAGQHHLGLVFDAAHAMGVSCKGVPLGGFGDAEVLSFHATKVISSGEGGAIVTNNSQLADRLRYMRNFGFSGMDSVEHLGTNGKMPELSAAMGITSLEALDTFITTNERNYLTYQGYFGGLTGVALTNYDGLERNNYHYVIIEVDERRAGMSRDDLWGVLMAERVLARRYFYPGVHRMEPYRSQLRDDPPLLPHTEALADRVLALPTGPAVSPSDIAMICSIIGAALSDPDRVRQCIAALDPPDTQELGDRIRPSGDI